MDNFYCNVIVENDLYPPGVYKFDAMFNYQLVYLSHSIWKETKDGVFCIKDKITGSKVPKPLTQDELKEFMWTKLKAKAHVT